MGALVFVPLQTKQFADKDNADLFAEEAAQQREVRPPFSNSLPITCFACCLCHLHSSIPGGGHSTDTPGVYPSVGHLTTHNVLPRLCTGCMWKVELCLPGSILWLRFCLTAASKVAGPTAVSLDARRRSGSGWRPSRA